MNIDQWFTANNSVIRGSPPILTFNGVTTSNTWLISICDIQLVSRFKGPIVALVTSSYPLQTPPSLTNQHNADHLCSAQSRYVVVPSHPHEDLELVPILEESGKAHANYLIPNSFPGHKCVSTLEVVHHGEKNQRTVVLAQSKRNERTSFN